MIIILFYPWRFLERPALVQNWWITLDTKEAKHTVITVEGLNNKCKMNECWDYVMV
jgi:hypothetical protein